MVDVEIVDTTNAVEEETPAQDAQDALEIDNDPFNIGITDDSFENVSIKSNGLVMTPSFADYDLDNIFDIYPHPELNSDLGGRQLLYGERYFPEMVLKEMLKNGDSLYNSIRYDGYMYYQEMPWAVPTQIGTGRGMFQEVPEKGWAGWVCYYNGEPENDELIKERYTCRSVMVDADEKMGFNAPDLTLEEYDVDLGFRCSVETRGEDFDVATCLMALPKAEEDSEFATPGLRTAFTGEHRYNPSDDYRITQFGFVANGESVT